MFQHVLQSSLLSAEDSQLLYRWREGTGAWHALASVVMVAGWSVASPAPALPLSVSVPLWLSVLSPDFPFFPCSTSPSSLCLCVSIPPSLLQHPPIPVLHSLSGCFCACCHLKSCLSVPRLKLYFSPDVSVLFEVSLLSVLLHFPCWE